MARQLWTCERCGAAANVVHHKIYITPLNINDPDITLNFDNLEALCHNCHNKEHKLGDFETCYAFSENGEISRAQNTPPYGKTAQGDAATLSPVAKNSAKEARLD
jgi:hypothetical protein